MDADRIRGIWQHWPFYAKMEHAGATRVWEVLKTLSLQTGYGKFSVTITRKGDQWCVMPKIIIDGRPHIAFFWSTSFSNACFKAERTILDGRTQWRYDKFKGG